MGSGVMSMEESAGRAYRRRLEQRFAPVIASVLEAAEKADNQRLGDGQVLRLQAVAFQCGLRGSLPPDWQQFEGK